MPGRGPGLGEKPARLDAGAACPVCVRLTPYRTRCTRSGICKRGPLEQAEGQTAGHFQPCAASGNSARHATRLPAAFSSFVIDPHQHAIQKSGNPFKSFNPRTEKENGTSKRVGLFSLRWARLFVWFYIVVVCHIWYALPMPAFPLATVCAVVGSRYGSPFGVGQFTTAVIQAGGHLITGCAAGVDSAAASAAAGAGAAVARVPALGSWAGQPAASRVVVAAGRTPSALATRTRLVVQHAAAVAVFPPVGGTAALGPGSVLVLRLALARSIPIFFAGPLAPPAAGFHSGTVAGVAGWLRFPPSAAVQSLF